MSEHDVPVSPLESQLLKAARGRARMAEIGIQQRPDGGMDLSPEAVRQLAAEHARRLTTSWVPSTPRMFQRDANGVAVRKNASRNMVSMETLRLVREKAPLMQAIHAARAAQVRRMSVRWSGRRGDVGWRVVHRDHHEINARPPKGFDRYIRQFETVLEKPAPVHNFTSTSPFFTSWEEDLLTINRPCTEVLFSALDPSRIVGFKPVDGALIWPTQFLIERWVAKNPQWLGRWSAGAISEEQAMDLLSDQMDVDLRVAEYALVRDGTVEATYDRRRLIVAPIMNRTDVTFNGYWPSNVEQALEVALTFCNTWEYNAMLFTKGMLAEFALGISGSMHPDDFDAFQDNFRDVTQGVRRAWQPPMLLLPEGGKLEKIDLKASNKDMLMEVFMALQAALCTAIYRMDPSTINARPWDGSGGTHMGGDAGRGTEIALAKEEGLQGDLQHLCESTLTPMAQACHPDMMVVMEYGDFDPQKEAAIYEIRARTSLTRNEVRLSEGLEPMGFWLPVDEYNRLDPDDEKRKRYEANPWNRPTDPGFAQQLQQAEQMDMQRQMMAQGQQPPDDGFGGPDQGQDDGFGGKPSALPGGAGGGGGPGAPGGGAPGGAPGGAQAPGPSQPSTPMAKGGDGRRLTVYVERWSEERG